MNKKWVVIIFVIFILGFSLIVPGCISNTLNLVEIHIPDGEIGYSLLRIDTANPEIIYDRETSNIELIFNKELSSKQNMKIFAISGEFLPKVLTEGDGFEISGHKIIIKEKISLGISSFLIPEVLRLNNNLSLDKDLYIYLSSKPFESDQYSDVKGVQKMFKRKDDGKTFGFSLRLDSLPVGKFTEKSLLDSYSKIPLLNKPDGEEILSLKNGDGFEILAESGNFYKVQVLYKEDLQSKIQKVQGYIEKGFVYQFPEPLNENTTYSIFSQQFLCVVAKKFMSNIPESLPYFSYIDVQVDNIAETGVELLERGALPVTSEKLSVLELNALFNAIVNSTDIQDNIQNVDLARLLNENLEIRKYYKSFIESYTKMLSDTVEQFKVPDKLKAAKQCLLDYINLKSNLLSFGINLSAENGESLNNLLNNFVKSFRGDKNTEKKLEDITSQFLAKQVKEDFDFNDFSNRIENNILKPIENKLSGLFDQAFFPEGNWIKEEFTNSKPL